MKNNNNTASVKQYTARCAKDAQAMGYGNESYWDMLEESAIRYAAFFSDKGDKEQAAYMMSRTLGQSLEGNDGE